MVVARLLTPADFGLVAMATAVTAIAACMLRVYTETMGGV